MLRPGVQSRVYPWRLALSLQISIKKCSCEMFMLHFDCADSHETGAPGFSDWKFPHKFHTKCLLWNVHVHFDCAGCHETGAPGVACSIFLTNFHTEWLLCNVRVHFDCAGSREMGAPGLAFGIFPTTKWLWWHVHVHFDWTRHLTQKSCQDGACTEILPREILRRSCSKILPRDLVQRSCQQSSYTCFAKANVGVSNC